MNEIIKINSDNKVSGRELHDFLEVGYIDDGLVVADKMLNGVTV